MTRRVAAAVGVGPGFIPRSTVLSGMSIVEPSYRTLRLLCANTVAMVAFLAAYVVAREPGVAVAAAVVIGVIGYVASSVVVDYAVGGSDGRAGG